ncbi:MAG: DUF1569 domain-containing protein [Aureispira sp.]
MKSLANTVDREEILGRIQNLQPDSNALWGKMTVAQMFAHCTGALNMATGELRLPRRLISYFIGPFLRVFYYNDRAFPKGLNTDKALVVTAPKDFQIEQQRLIDALQNYPKEATAADQGAVHPLLGYFTAAQWAKGMYKHLDYHLQQFGV